MEKFPSHESCIDYLESIRFEELEYCPHCASRNVARKSEKRRDKEYPSGLKIKEKQLIGRWNCHDCKSSFNVLSGTIFQGTKIPLQKWFVAVSLIVNAKKSFSSYQLAREIGVSQNSAWHMMQRVRAEMTANNKVLLHRIADDYESCIDSKPRKSSKRSDSDNENNERGHGIKKSPVIGVGRRGGNVNTRVADDLTGKQVLNVVRCDVNLKIFGVDYR